MRKNEAQTGGSADASESGATTKNGKEARK